MKYRKLTMEESFPLAFQKGLNKVQSEHFVNNVLAKGAIEKGYECRTSSLRRLQS